MIKKISDDGAHCFENVDVWRGLSACERTDAACLNPQTEVIRCMSATYLNLWILDSHWPVHPFWPVHQSSLWQQMSRLERKKKVGTKRKAWKLLKLKVTKLHVHTKLVKMNSLALSKPKCLQSGQWCWSSSSWCHQKTKPHCCSFVISSTCIVWCAWLQRGNYFLTDNLCLMRKSHKHKVFCHYALFLDL